LKGSLINPPGVTSFDRRNERFEYRAPGLCVHDGYVPLTKPDQDDHWFLPGGRAGLLDISRTILHPESIEEAG
jgi:hypothetical protein